MCERRVRFWNVSHERFLYFNLKTVWAKLEEPSSGNAREVEVRKEVKMDGASVVAGNVKTII